ncbi:MAG: hypothetical protein K8R21_02770 [Leptospira sp.]|nr:hypothetical protein [Leptospira sp.]
MNEWIPPRPGFFMRTLSKVLRAASGTDAPIAQTLSWYPRALIGAVIFEFFAPRSKHLKRTLNHVRLCVSFSVRCKWCIEMNSVQLKKNRITQEELGFLNGTGPRPLSITDAESIAIEYTRHICRTPVEIPSDLAKKLKRSYSEKELVMLSWTAAQVNFFSRLFQSWIVKDLK